jgi:hypothetical protein
MALEAMQHGREEPKALDESCVQLTVDASAV